VYTTNLYALEELRNIHHEISTISREELQGKKHHYLPQVYWMHLVRT